jgi:hypothetical protein
MDYKLSKHALDVIDARNIKSKWIEFVLENPTVKNTKASNEVNFFAPILESENRCLKIVLNPISLVVITAYFDRNMRKKGCK